MGPVIGQLGRKPTKHDARNLRLAPILAAIPKLPAAPFARNWGRHYLANGDLGDPIIFGTFSNLTYGDCTCAAFGHMDQAVSEATRTPSTVTTEMVLEAYDAISGWDRSTPSANDDGANNLDALKWFRRQGLITAYAQIDERDLAHIELCINLYQAVYVGVDLPLAAQKQKIWDVAPVGPRDPSYDRRSWGGHAMMAVGYDAIGVWFVTWGRLQFATWPWFFTYVDEAYVGIHRQFVASSSALTPAGFIASQIVAALANV